VRLAGIHHITCITADARGCVDFYAGTLGLRLVKRTVNFDAPDVLHVYFGDEEGSPGSILTFFAFPDAARGRAGAGMIHRLQWRVGSPRALEFWAERLAAGGVELVRASEPVALAFADPEGLTLELFAEAGGAPGAHAVDVPREHALRGLRGLRAYADPPGRADALLTDALGFSDRGAGTYVLERGGASATYAYDPPPAAQGLQGAGTVHHVAWAVPDAEHPAWRERLLAAGTHPTPVLDRRYFRSIYVREPRGVLFELATLGPGFAVDEEPEHLGERLRLPPEHEHLRERLERTLPPLPDPRRRTPAA
jgi:glyoxalase family protein